MVEQDVGQQGDRVAAAEVGQRGDEGAEHRVLVRGIAGVAEIGGERGEGGVGRGEDRHVFEAAHCVDEARRVEGANQQGEVVRPGGDVDDVVERLGGLRGLRRFGRARRGRRGVAGHVDGEQDPVDRLDDAVRGEDIAGHDRGVGEVGLQIAEGLAGGRDGGAVEQRVDAAGLRDVALALAAGGDVIEQHVGEHGDQVAAAEVGQRGDEGVEHRVLVRRVAGIAEIGGEGGEGGVGRGEDGDVVQAAHGVHEAGRIEGTHEQGEVVRPGCDVDDVVGSYEIFAHLIFPSERTRAASGWSVRRVRRRCGKFSHVQGCRTFAKGQERCGRKSHHT